MKSEVKQKCFVIMPFSQTSEQHTEEYWTNHYKEFIKPLIEEKYPLVAERSFPLRGDILRQIITNLVTVPIVVADLTDANLNVYWELGVRQSFKHGTITIAESGTSRPFDLSAKGTLYYFPHNHIKMQEFQNHFHEAIDDCLKNPDLPDSHVLETIGGRGTLYQILYRDEILRRLDAIEDEIKHNEVIHEVALDQCNKNIEYRSENKAKKCKYPTGLLRHVAVEMLVVNRYIDAEADFYEIAEEYFDDLTRLNAQLIVWPNQREQIEEWLLDQKKFWEPSVKEFKKKIKEYREAIRSIL